MPLEQNSRGGGQRDEAEKAGRRTWEAIAGL